MTEDARKRIGLVGFGTIGGAIARAAIERGFAVLDYVVTKHEESGKGIPSEVKHFQEIGAVADRRVDLVVEAVDDQFVRDNALAILEHSDLLLFSLTSLSDDGFREQVREQCARKKRRLYLPHGAVLGLDGINDGRALLTDVSITTTKHPRNLALQEGESGTVFDGSVREACKLFPRNVNVHAAVALAGLGFDDTHSRVIADPTSKRMRHEIRVKGSGLAWEIVVESQAVGSVTGSYTPESAAGTVQRVVGGTYDIVLA